MYKDELELKILVKLKKTSLVTSKCSLGDFRF